MKHSILALLAAGALSACMAPLDTRGMPLAEAIAIIDEQEWPLTCSRINGSVRIGEGRSEKSVYGAKKVQAELGLSNRDVNAILDDKPFIGMSVPAALCLSAGRAEVDTTETAYTYTVHIHFRDGRYIAADSVKGVDYISG